MNTNQTKIICIEGAKGEIRLEHHRIKQVKKGKYLGSIIIESSGKLDRHINNIVAAANNLDNVLYRTFLNKKEVSRTKLKVYNEVLVPVLLYGAKTWCLTARHRKMLRAYEMWFLRRVMGVMKMEKLENTKKEDC